MVYLDSSAIVKLVVPEPESAALRRRLAREPDWVSSALAVVEVVRAIRRREATVRELEEAQELLARIALAPVDDSILGVAARMDPTALRSLDAIHVATAQSLFGLEAFVTYDVRQLAAAVVAGLPAISPT